MGDSRKELSGMAKPIEFRFWFRSWFFILVLKKNFSFGFDFNLLNKFWF